jgi:NO-binding membrane sensor protein with MHYT domain/CheY-like chemotaxis protein/nitrogen-specific signal transduction histidine kinase
VPQHYHHGLVFVSLAVAILASYTALNLALRIRDASRAAAPAWLLGGGFAMGTGIWSMHFVGMLALSLPIEIGYDLTVTLLSLLIAILVSSFALHIASRERVGTATLATAAIAMGIGICAMHYVGMAAIQITPNIQYHPVWVTASFAVAIAASFAAFGIAFTTRTGRWRRYQAAAGAVGMGVAISGMHYVGMFAAQFPVGAQSATTTAVDKGWLAGSVTMMTLFVLFATLLLSYVESRAAARAARMQASLAEAAEESRAKDEFLAMLGHELRNPLASISNAAHLLGRAPANGVEWRFAQDVITRQATHLSHIVEDLLDVGRAISGKMSLAFEPLDLHVAVEQALQSLRAAGKTADRRVDCEGGSAWVEADRTRIEQIVSNLVSNAVQHTQPRGRITVRVFARDHDAMLSVSDDGVGMDSETAARAFEPFYQARQDPDRQRGGLGIGLTLVRRIVEMQGGTISGASDGPGRGSTFTVCLPLIPAPGTARSGNAPGGAASGRQVVIVEDSKDTRLSLQKILEHEGHTVHTAADGPSGLAAILRHRPDVALVDIGLPGIDGYGLAERLRVAGLRTYLVALTGYGLAEDKKRARIAGFDAHLTKPAPMEDVLRLVSDGKHSTA